MLLAILVTSTSWAQPEILNPKFEKKIDDTIDNSVTTVSCARLNYKINTPNLYLLDAREKNEYEVSHLKDAIWVGYEKFQKDSVTHIPKDAIVVVYCSIGYRSEKIGEQLKKMGYSRIYNLYGGIFEWSNRAYPLVNISNEETGEVHAYDRDWGRWLKTEEKVFK